MKRNDFCVLKLNGVYTKLNCRLKDKTGWELIDIIFLLGCIFSSALMFVRAFFGTEFTDEAYTVSDALAVMHGNIPFTYNNSMIAVGMSFIPVMFYKIYELFVPDLEGIFLYSRLTFVVFRLCIIVAIYILLKGEVSRKHRLLIAGVLIPFVGSSVFIQNWGYNATATYIILLTVFMLYNTLRRWRSGIKQYIRLFASGFLTAIGVFAHPVYVVAVFVFIFLICMNVEKKEQFKAALLYCMGGILEIFIVLIPIILQSGLDKFFYGAETMLVGGPKGYIKDTVFERASYVVSLIWPGWILLGSGTILIYYLSRKFIRLEEKESFKKEYWILAVGYSILFCIIYYIIVIQNDFYIFVGSVCVGAFLLLIPTYKRWSSLSWYLGVYNISFIIVMTITTLTGDRLYYCIPMLIPVLIILFHQRTKLFHYIAVFISVIMILLQGYTDFTDVYRDDMIANLTTRVELGVYKGIYTTADRAKDVVELEQYLNENIREEESVSFRDNAPVAYLMRNTNICDVRTWDTMQYSYGCDDPTLMYRYYKNKEQIPDVIAYIDFGRDKVMSIENSSDVFQYNDFVNKYFYLDQNDFKNDTFRVLIYRNNGTFDNDFDGLIESVH